MATLPASQVLFLHGQVAAALGAPRGGARPAALAAALREAESSQEGGLFERAAALGMALARHRPFAAASLAVAAAAAGLFLRQYDLDLQLAADDAPRLRSLLLEDATALLADWLRAHTAPLPLD